jgi:anti-sigma B factor antagonist
LYDELGDFVWVPRGAPDADPADPSAAAGDSPKVADFEVFVSCERHRAVVTVRGEVDIATAPMLQHRLVDLIETGIVHISIALAEMTFIDSSGLAVLVAALRAMSRVAGGVIVLVSPTANTRRVLDISGVATLFAIT